MSAVTTSRSALAIAALVAVGACGLDWTIDEQKPGSDGAGTSGDGAGTASAQASSSGTTGAAGGAGGVPGGGGGGDGGVGGAGVGPASASAVASSTGSGQPLCDEQPTCEACDACSVNAGCMQVYEDCLANASCAALDACIYNDCASLGDAGCISFCYDDYPAGAALFDQVGGCIVCDECAGNCFAFQFNWGC